jgi:ABC-2 type transport system ATP-binding protein/ribosome-dependent ATPase
VSTSGGLLAETTELSRAFGTTMAVDGVTMRVSPGEIVGLIGANGAGKTTLIRMLLGLLGATAGHVRLFGAAPSRQTRGRVGYVPQGLGLYRDLTVAENVAFVSAAYGRPTPPAGVLAEFSDDLVAEIGLGRQRQLAFACALDHAPELLVLDEPTSGVDPIARARLWDTIHNQAEAGAGLLVSTHYMQEADQCDRLILMDRGRIVAEGTRHEIIGGATVVLVRAGDWAGSFQALRAAGLPVALAGREVRVVDTSPDTVSAALRAAGVTAHVDVVPATLEEKMIAITRGRGDRHSNRLA